MTLVDRDRFLCVTAGAFRLDTARETRSYYILRLFRVTADKRVRECADVKRRREGLWDERHYAHDALGDVGQPPPLHGSAGHSLDPARAAWTVPYPFRALGDHSARSVADARQGGAADPRQRLHAVLQQLQWDLGPVHRRVLGRYPEWPRPVLVFEPEISAIDPGHAVQELHPLQPDRHQLLLQRHARRGPARYQVGIAGICGFA